MDRVYNFSAGPSQMPIEVLKKAQEEMLNFENSGTSIMEMSHRSDIFMKVLDDTKNCLKRIMEIPDDYEILFLPGGATGQFSMIPMNLAKREDTVAYVTSGRFASIAKEEASRWCNVIEIASSKEDNYTYIPSINEEDIPDNCKYLHITGNNTVYGTVYNKLPKHKNIPLVCDWSSAILGKWIDVKDYDLIYAGAQKNMGVAGVCVVIVKKSLLKDEIDNIVPKLCSYKKQIEADSMYNTPPCWQIYMCGLMAKWVEDNGGIRQMELINKEKSSLLYDYIDSSKVFKNNVRKSDRSITNVTFVLENEELTKEFLQLCNDNGLINLKGHKSAGGIRASIYNGMPIDGVKKLIEVMKEFEKNVQH